MKLRIPSFLITPSTLEFTREARQTPGFSLFDWLHGTVYARWLYLYIGIGTGEHALARRFGPWVNRVVMLKKSLSTASNPEGIGKAASENDARGSKTFADTYHGKVLPLESARQLVTVGEDICLPDLEHVIPYARARDLILKNPDHITALDCPCRVSRPNPCLPLGVCLIIGEPFASYIFEHHPDRSRWISQDEAVEILGEEEQRGHVHHAFFKDAMLGRFYAICNCCSCCCGAMEAQRNGTPMLTSSGYVAEIDEVLCIGCGTCEDLCQFNAISVPNGCARVDVASCMGCGVCCTNCEQGAVTLQLDPSKGAPLEIQKLMEQAVG